MKHIFSLLALFLFIVGNTTAIPLLSEGVRGGFHSPLLLEGSGDGGHTPLLLEGSGEAPAEADPFGEVDIAKYPNTMTITGYVRINGEVLGDETVVAVYQGDELRGKKSPMTTDKYTSILMITVHGSDAVQPLHFKVYTNGRIIEVDQGLYFMTDARVGKAKAPYYIDLPEPVVTTFSDEGWATTCLPFNADVPEGVDVWYASGIQNGTLQMTRIINNGDGPLRLPAETPELLHVQLSTSRSALPLGSAKNFQLSTFEWLSRVADGNFTTDGNILVGTTVDMPVRAGSVLTLGHSTDNGSLGFWRFKGTLIPAYHAYLTNVPSNVRGITFPEDINGDAFEDNAPTAIDELSTVNSQLSTVRSQLSTVNSQLSTVNDLLGRKIVNNKWSNRQMFKRCRDGQIIRLLP